MGVDRSRSKGRDVSVYGGPDSVAVSRRVQPHSVQLNQAAMDILERRQGDHLSHVFTYEGNSIVQVNTKAWRNALLRAGIHDFLLA